LDAVGAVHEVSGTRLHAEAVERGLAKRRLGALAEIGGDGEIARLEGTLERCLELARGIGGIELGASNGNPRAAARGPGADIGRDAAVGTEGEPDQFGTAAFAAGEDAGPLGSVRFSLVCRSQRLILRIPHWPPPRLAPARP